MGQFWRYFRYIGLRRINMWGGVEERAKNTSKSAIKFVELNVHRSYILLMQVEVLVCLMFQLRKRWSGNEYNIFWNPENEPSSYIYNTKKLQILVSSVLMIHWMKYYRILTIKMTLRHIFSRPQNPKSVLPVSWNWFFESSCVSVSVLVCMWNQ